MIQKLEYETHKDGNGNVCGAIPSDAEIIAKVNEVIDYINSRPEEKPSEELKEEVKRYYSDNFTYISSDQPTLSILTNVARHFAEWGARYSINWGDVQLLDTFILELSREEKDGADWGDSEKFYTEVLRRFHEFNDKKIPEIVAEWEAEHLKK